MNTLLARLSKIPTAYLITFLFLATCVCYLNTLSNSLFFDDEFFIYNNVFVKNFSIGEFFTKNVDAGAGIVSNYYRPLTLLIFATIYALFQDAGGPYHLISFLIHAGGGVVLFFVLAKLSNRFIGFLTSLLFLIHPIQTEAVSYASGLSDPLSVLFIVLTLHVFLTKPKHYYLLLSLCYFLAILSKEPAIMTPALMLLCLWLKEKQHVMKALKKELPSFYLLAGVGGAYMLSRLTFLNFQNTLNFYNDTSPYATNIIIRMFTFFSILPTYIGLLLFPKVLYIDRVVPVITTFNPLVISVAVVLLILCGGAVLLRNRFPILLFSILWFFITIAPASGIIPINGIIYEHFLYLPSVGFFFLISHFTYFLFKKSMASNLGLSAVFLFGFFLISALMIRTIVRNAEWHDPITFYTQTLSHNPQSLRSLNNIAMAYAAEGENAQAITFYRKALSYPNIYPQIHYNLANSHLEMKQYGAAEKEYQETLKKDPFFWQVYPQLYRLYLETEQDGKAQKLLEELEQKGKTNTLSNDVYKYLKGLK